MLPLFLDRMTTLIVSIVTQIAAIAMTGFIKRIGYFPPPTSYRHHSCKLA